MIFDNIFPVASEKEEENVEMKKVKKSRKKVLTWCKLCDKILSVVFEKEAKDS